MIHGFSWVLPGNASFCVAVVNDLISCSVVIRICLSRNDVELATCCKSCYLVATLPFRRTPLVLAFHDSLVIMRLLLIIPESDPNGVPGLCLVRTLDTETILNWNGSRFHRPSETYIRQLCSGSNPNIRCAFSVLITLEKSGSGRVIFNSAGASSCSSSTVGVSKRVSRAAM